MNTKKLTQQSITTMTDEDGQVIESIDTKIFTFPKEPPFIKLYLEDIERIYVLPDGTHRVLFELLKKLDYEGFINLNITVKKRIVETINWKTVASLDNYISKHLVKKGIFKKAGTGVYIPDPSLFGRGEWKDIYNRRDGWMKITYKNNKRDVVSNFAEE